MADETVELFGHITNVPQENIVVFIAWKQEVLGESVEVKSINLAVMGSFGHWWFERVFSDVVEGDLLVLEANCKHIGIAVHPLDILAHLNSLNLFEW